MAKKKTTRTYRYKYRYRYRRKRYTEQVFKAKIEKVVYCMFPNNNPGTLNFFDQNAQNGNPSVSFNSILTASTFYGSLMGTWGFFKVLGAKIEVINNPGNFGGIQGTRMSINLVGVNLGQNQTVPTFNAALADDRTMLLGSQSVQKKYFPLSRQTDWLPAVENPNNLGLFYCTTNVQSQRDDEPIYQLKLSLYLAFKKSKV